MRIAVTSTHTPKYAPLAVVTTPNHLAYCERHGYDYISRRTAGVEFPEMLHHDLNMLCDTIEQYDATLKVETDVVFTAMDKWVEDFIKMNDSIIVGREPKGRAILNVGVMIFYSRYSNASKIINRVALEKSAWINNHNDCYWQNYLGRLYNAEESVRSAIRLVEPRLINATDQTGDPEWTWQPGDFVCHCGGGSVESRIERCREAMRKAGV